MVADNLLNRFFKSSVHPAVMHARSEISETAKERSLFRLSTIRKQPDRSKTIQHDAPGSISVRRIQGSESVKLWIYARSTCSTDRDTAK